MRCLPVAALSSFALLALSGCDPRPGAPSIALEFAFDDSVTPAAWIDIAHAASPTGITFEPGVEGRAARFDGSGAQVDVSGVDALPLTRAFTVETHVKAADWTNPYTSGSALESIVSHSDDFTIAIVPSKWTYQAVLHTSEGQVRLEGGAVRVGTWQHVALAFDASEHMARLYVDGIVADQREAKGTFALQPGLPVRVGTWFKQNQAYCGALDCLRIWDRALESAELVEHAAATKP